MTMRQFLRQRSEQYACRAMGFLLVSGALVTIATRSFVIRSACAVVIGVVVVSAFWSLFQIPCPRCRKPLGMAGFRAATSGIRNMGMVPPHCPHCYVSFDEPLPPAE
jgi:hypothetical protein